MRHSRPAWQPCMPLKGTPQINMEHTAPRLQPVVVWVPPSSDQPVTAVVASWRCVVMLGTHKPAARQASRDGSGHVVTAPHTKVTTVTGHSPGDRPGRAYPCVAVCLI